jgi:hypothetical protein
VSAIGLGLIGMIDSQGLTGSAISQAESKGLFDIIARGAVGVTGWRLTRRIRFKNNHANSDAECRDADVVYCFPKVLRFS